MPGAEQIAEKAGQLRALQANWESIKRNASAELQTLASGQGQYTDNAQEQLRAQIANAAFRLEQIAQELNRIVRLQEEQARQDALRQETQREQSLRDKEAAPLIETARKDELAGEERGKAEAFQKEQELKADALEKERQDREFFENKERERLEAFQKEDRDRQEIEKQELSKKDEVQQKEGQSELDFLGEQLMDINQEWQYILDQIDAEWQYIDEQINEEMEYNVEQTIEVVAEVVDEIALAIRDPVSEREREKFLEEKAKELEAFMRTEDFQGQSADTKKQFLEDRIKEQNREADEKFGSRGDEFGNREVLSKKLDNVHDIAMETVQREQKIEQRALDEIKDLKEMAAQQRERIENAGYDDTRKTAELDKLAEFVKMREQMIRDDAEKARQELYKEMKLLEEERERERQRQIEAARAAQAASLQF